MTQDHTKPSRRQVLVIVALVFCAMAVMSLIAAQSQASGASLSPAALPQWGTDIRVNPTPVGTPYRPLQRNYSLAVNPANQNTVFAGWESFEEALHPSSYAWSTDQGLTWLGGRFSGLWDPGEMAPDGSVSVGFDGHGTAYYSSFAQGSGVAGYFVLTTTTGLTWGTPMPVVAFNFDSPVYYYQSNLAVDQRVSGPYAGSLYMFWLYTDLNYPNWQYGIRERYSRDGGRTWSADLKVTDPANDDIYYPFGAVASDGTVYVAFEELDAYYVYNQPKLYLARSTDGGQTWSQNHLISGAPIVPMGRVDFKRFELTLLGSANCTLIHINHYPYIAISPSDPQTVYAVWNDGRWDSHEDLCTEPGRHSDIAFSRSTDGGSTWSSPVRINDDTPGNGIDQFLPNIAARSDGLLGVTWLDRRYNSNHYLYDLAYSQSTDGGVTWSANQRVSDTSTDPDQLYDYKIIDNLGYRNGLVFGSNYVLPSWPNVKPTSTVGNFFTDHGVIATAVSTSSNTPIMSATPTRTPSSTSTPTSTSTSTSIPTSTPTSAMTATAPSSPSATSSIEAASTPTSLASFTPTRTPTTCTIQFADVQPGSTFYSFVRCLACGGIVSGYPCGGLGEPCPGLYFRPGNDVTRGQAAKIIANSANYQEIIPPDRQTFNDVPPASTFWLYIERVALHGAIHGYPCGGTGEPCPGAYFRPSNNLTRGQLAQIDSYVAGYSDAIPPNGQTFNDVPPASTFWLYVERVYLHDVINGYPCGGLGEPCPGLYFRPGNDVTRGQTTKIVSNTFFPDCDIPVR